MYNILIIDDEKEIADLIEIYLKNENFNTFKYYSSENIIDKISKVNIDLAILDVMMPGTDGFSLCNALREKYNFPILFVTARIEEIDKINGFSLGADDYITKPFKPLELVARVKSNLRRYKKYNDQSISTCLYINGIIINKITHECSINDKVIFLTPIEFEILWYLCTKAGCVVKTDELFYHVWKEKYFEKDNNTVMVHIRHIREKIDEKNGTKYIKTVWGVGYKIEK